jgi:hypothetical protein
MRAPAGSSGRFQVTRIIRAALTLLKAEICLRKGWQCAGNRDFPGTSSVRAVRRHAGLGYTSASRDPG